MIAHSELFVRMFFFDSWYHFKFYVQCRMPLGARSQFYVPDRHDDRSLEHAFKTTFAHRNGLDRKPNDLVSTTGFDPNGEPEIFIDKTNIRNSGEAPRAIHRRPIELLPIRFVITVWRVRCKQMECPFRGEPKTK